MYDSWLDKDSSMWSYKGTTFILQLWIYELRKYGPKDK